MTIKPFSAYPEARAKLLKLADKITEDEIDSDVDLYQTAVQLADLVQAILRDEGHYDEDEPT